LESFSQQTWSYVILYMNLEIVSYGWNDWRSYLLRKKTQQSSFWYLYFCHILFQINYHRFWTFEPISAFWIFSSIFFLGFAFVQNWVWQEIVRRRCSWWGLYGWTRELKEKRKINNSRTTYHELCVFEHNFLLLPCDTDKANTHDKVHICVYFLNDYVTWCVKHVLKVYSKKIREACRCLKQSCSCDNMLC
jgi:hypothetical protein